MDLGDRVTDRVAHWLRQNKAARIPRRIIVLDSEAIVEQGHLREQHTLRCAVATFDKLDHDARPTGRQETISTADPAELWEWVASRTAQSHRTVLWAHNLSYDLRLTSCLHHLPKQGFTLKGMAIGGQSTWWRWSDGKRSLWLVDTFSWLPRSLETIAAQIGMVKPALPAQDDPPEVWQGRCLEDVRITRAAILRLLQWLRSEDMGDFRLTGAAQASAAFRHRFLQPRTLLIHAEPDALAAERRAAHCGRAEVWTHGTVEGLVHEYDYRSCYARIAADCDIPSRLVGETYLTRPGDLEKALEHYAVLADVTVTTDTPSVPCQLPDRVLWPVGTFRTTLWDCEIRLALETGATVETHRVWTYQRTPVLRPWAEWVLDGIDGKGAGSDPLIRLLLKEWSRALIGRFGLRYPLLEHAATVGYDDLCSYPVKQAGSADGITMVQIGRELYEQSGMVESSESAPMIMGWVMAQARVRLWAAMSAAQPSGLLAVDTDGLLVNQAGRKRLDALIASGDLAGLRRKGQYRGATLRGPKNLDLGDERRIAGVPRLAERISPDRYRGQAWQTMSGALSARSADRVIVAERVWKVKTTDRRRLHLEGGSTAPYVLSS